MSAKQQCDKCSGAGTVPREVRKLEDGKPDPSDFRTTDICEKCGGSGVIPEALRVKTAGNIADITLAFVLAFGLSVWPALADTLTYNGVIRSYIVHVPTNCQAPAPLVLALHGRGGNGAAFESKTGLSTIANESCFNVVYPTAYGGDWDKVNDVGFLTAIVAKVSYDPKRLYVLGHSEGGGMAEAYACAVQVAALADFSHVLSRHDENACKAPATPALLVHGTADPVSPYGGQNGGLSAQGTAQFWAAKSGQTMVQLPSISIRLDTGSVGTATVIGSASVTFYALTGAGHPFPYDKPARYNANLGHTVTAIDPYATQPGARLAWDFFRRFSR